jgi:histidyl-tRNA synthetase
MKYAAPPYMHDVLPFEPSKDKWLHSAKWRALERIFEEICLTYGYKQIRTPVMEQTELFLRSIGQGTDIVSKEMFTFTDRGGRSMTLRPEGTAPAIRAYVEHNLHAENSLVKLYYIASIYRYERGQKGRFREHQQTGVEALGSKDPALDAEIITLAMGFYERLGIPSTELKLNSVGCPVCRPQYRDALLDFVRPRLEMMSPDNKTRYDINPLRMLDSKDERDKRALEGAPILLDHLCTECREHFEALKRYLDALSVPYVIDTNLVRGFDYYTKTAFEIVCPALGAQNAIGGGGRYDGLVEEIGGAPTPGIGFGIGTERCLLALDQLGISLPVKDASPMVFVAALGDETKLTAAKLVHDLRRAGVSTDTDYSQRRLKLQMRQSDKLGAQYMLIIGPEEIERGEVVVRKMFGEKDQVHLPISTVVQYFLELSKSRGASCQEDEL